MSTLIEELNILKSEISLLKEQIKDLQTSSDVGVPTSLKPYSKVGGSKDPTMNYAIDIKSGFGGTYGNTILWNDAELALPPYGEPPVTPKQGYHQHTHSRYAGGALNIAFLECVEYTALPLPDPYDPDNWSGNFNPHCQQFWDNQPSIAKMTDSEGNSVEKIGPLYLEFDPVYKVWFSGIREIDVARTALVKKDDKGEIEIDSKENPKSSPMYVGNPSFDDVVWDETARMWRFYAVYAEEPEEVEE